MKQGNGDISNIQSQEEQAGHLAAHAVNCRRHFLSSVAARLAKNRILRPIIMVIWRALYFLGEIKGLSDAATGFAAGAGIKGKISSARVLAIDRIDRIYTAARIMPCSIGHAALAVILTAIRVMLAGVGLIIRPRSRGK